MEIDVCPSHNLNEIFFVPSQAEWEALKIHEHKWALENAEQELLGTYQPQISNLPNQIKKTQ